MKLQHSSYTENTLSGPKNLRDTIRRTVKALRPKVGEFDAIAFRGTSGALMAPIISALLKKHLIMVRKRDGHHGQYEVEGALDCRYIILDDIIATGGTVNTIQLEIKDVSPDALCVGIYLYRDGYWANRHIRPTARPPTCPPVEEPLDYSRPSIYSYPQAECP